MADNVNDNLYPIPYITGNFTFADWASHYNTLAINKLNLMKIYDGISGDGINLTLGTTADNDPVGGDWDGSKPDDLPAGTFRVSLADSIPKGITFEEDVTISGTLNYDLSKNEFPSLKMRLYPDKGFTGTVGFTFGMPLRVSTSPESSGCSGDATYYLGRADSRDYAEVFGVVSAVTWPDEGSAYSNSNTYVEVTTAGKIEGDFSRANDDNTGLSAGTVYFLSTGNSGGFTPIEPTIAGHISKPVLLGLTGNTGVVLNYRGQYLQGTGTGGTGGIDNNRFIVVTTEADLIRGVVVGYDGGNWRKCSSTGIVSDAVGLITKRFTADSTDYIEIVTSGHVDNIPTDYLGLLYVDADGLLTSGAVPGVGKPFAIAWPDSGGSSTKRGVIINQNHSGTDAAGRSLPQGATMRDLGGGTSWAYRSTTMGGATFGSAVNENLLINGDFDIWQRGVGVGGAYGGHDTTYFADRWVRTNGTTAGLSSFTIERKEFDKNQNDVYGSPKYYVATNHTLSGAVDSGDYVRIENRVEDVRTVKGEDVTMSFHAKCGVTGSTMGLVVTQWDGKTSPATSTEVATANLGTLWGKYEISFNVPDVTAIPAGSKHYVAFGFDVTHIGTDLDIAKVKVERGLVATVNETLNPEEELEKCSRYYQRSYNREEMSASETMMDDRMPTLTVIDFISTPTKDYLHRFPVRMRGIPSMTMYSPKTGITGDAYNRTAKVDMKKSSGTFGLGTARVAPSGSDTIRAEFISEDGVLFSFPNGSVLWDQISTHYVADAELDENM